MRHQFWDQLEHEQRRGRGSSGKRSSLGEHGKYSNIVRQIERTRLNVVVSVVLVCWNFYWGGSSFSGLAIFLFGKWFPLIRVGLGG